MMKLLLLLFVAVVFGGQSAPEKDEYRIDLGLKAGKVSLNLKADRPFNPKDVIKSSHYILADFL